MHSSVVLHALSLIPGIGNKTLRVLLDHFGSAEAIWEADEQKIIHSKCLRSNTLPLFIHERKTLDPEQEWEKIIDQGIDILAFTDVRYPRLLKEIPDAPMILFTRGNYVWEEKPLIAIVGSRKFTSYGEQAAYHLATDLASAGYVVVSGLAFGIDSIAHKAALDAHAETLAVLAGGVDDISIAPQTHLPLARNVMHSGALLSEYRPGTQAQEGTFPARNRIVAGMCLGTLVIEAPERSGALITARLALDDNREVFAVPGSIFSPLSFGTNNLIKAGAKIVTSVQDILEEFPLPEKNISSSRNTLFQKDNTFTQEEEKMLSFLSHEPVHIDKIIKATKLETSSVNSSLALLEIKGLIRNVGGMYYVRT